MVNVSITNLDGKVLEIFVVAADTKAIAPQTFARVIRDRIERYWTVRG